MFAYLIDSFIHRFRKLKKSNLQRKTFLGVFIFISLFAVLARYAWLSFIPNNFRQKLIVQGEKQFDTEIILTKTRAEITDRNGHILAMTVQRPSVFMIPRRIPKNDPDLIKKISQKFKMPQAAIESAMKSRKSFLWLSRKMEQDAFESLGNLKEWREFIGIIEEPKRIYPNKETASHLIGFVDIDNKGLEGVERMFEEDLQGSSYKVQVQRDARGNLVVIAPDENLQFVPDAAPLALSIDVMVQSLVEAELKETVKESNAAGGSAIVMNIQTGEIISMASYPTYDPNKPPQDDEKRRFRPVMDALELGSVLKPVFVAKALDMGVVKPQEKIWCENGSFAIDGKIIHDVHPEGWLTPLEILKYSSNICLYKMVKKIGRKEFYESILKSGLGRSPGLGFPGEWAGRISPPSEWKEIRFANMAFGQGIANSALQLANSIAIVTGSGVDPEISILPKDPYDEPTYGPSLRFIKESTSRLIVSMMESVVEEGSGKKANIHEMQVAGKTGTAQKYSQITKSYSGKILSFVGVFPANDPKFLVTVTIDEPNVKNAFGGVVAAPVFARIGQSMLKYLNARGLVIVK